MSTTFAGTDITDGWHRECCCARHARVDLIEVGRQWRAVAMLAAFRALPEMVTRLIHSTWRR